MKCSRVGWVQEDGVLLSFSRVAGTLSRRISEFDSETAKEWQKDGSLVVDIETIQDGGRDGATLTANRTVVLGFDRSAKAKIRKSTPKFTTEKQ